MSNQYDNDENATMILKDKLNQINVYKIYIYLIGRISNSLKVVDTKSNSYFESESPNMEKM